MKTKEEKKTLIVIDGNSIVHRAYHALPRLTTKKGELVNAVYGFILVFLKAINDFHPDFIAAAFDLSAPTFRHKKYKEYKATRPHAPEELYSQIPKIKEVLKAFRVPVFEKEGFEADDIIATIVSSESGPEISKIILSGDSDSLQLVDSQTKVYILRKGVKDIMLYDRDQVKEKFHGLVPEQLLDYKSLRGDPSDNIPGVTGIGEKTATELILQFWNLENLYDAIDKNSKGSDKIRPKVKEILLKYKAQAFLSKELVKLEKNVPISFDLEKSRWEFDKGEIIKLFEEMNFYSLSKRIRESGQGINQEKKKEGKSGTKNQGKLL
ncbi:MAG: 5'-3' exonuclease H3TH domain-containing protein [Patescibacteria group bacterium]